MERPILFSTPMVQAILAGRKTQTRRIFKGTTEHKEAYNPAYLEKYKDSDGWKKICPFGQIGDKLWVRETWRPYSESRVQIEYKADGKIIDYPDRPSFEFYGCGQNWRPSIFMPRWASRITLVITDVRVERLQDISEEDAKAEGCDYNPNFSPCQFYKKVWNSINGKTYPWESNPWVWVISFKEE